MKKVIEVIETTTRSYRIEVDDETAQLVKQNNFFEPYCGDEVSLEDLTHFHTKGSIADEEINIDYAVMFDIEEDTDIEELYYSR